MYLTTIPGMTTNQSPTYKTASTSYTTRLLMPHASQTQVRGSRQSSLLSAQRETRRIMGNALSSATRYNRDQLWSRYLEFLARNNLPQTDTNIAVFVTSTRVKPASGLTYVSNLKAMAHPKSPLEQFTAGLLRLKANDDVHKAHPITRAQVMRLIRVVQSSHQRVFIYLAWRTASRMDDIERLSRDCVLKADNTMIVLWWRHTKSSAVDPYQARFFVVLTPSKWTDDNMWEEAVTYCSTMPPWPDGTRAHIRKAMENLDGNLSDHSFKTGAISALMELAAQDLIPLSVISLLAKHKTAENAMATTTVGYVQNQVALALALKTQIATIHL